MEAWRTDGVDKTLIDAGVKRMLSPFKIILVACLLLSLSACKDLLSKPLASAHVPESPRVLDGSWLSKDGSKRLAINKTAEQGVYQFRYQEGAKTTEGRFVVSYFKARMVFNVDLSTVRINEQLLMNSETPIYMLFGAQADDKELRLTPAQMDKFERNFANYFFATPINSNALCEKTQELCTTHFSSGNVLLSKRMRKFNDEFVKKYRTVFPGKEQVIFKRV